MARAAAVLADEEGLECLTLARVAERLGVRTPSLYNHLPGLSGLRREMAVLGVRELGRRLGRAAIGKSSDEAIEALADAYRAFVKERPGLYAASLPASGSSGSPDPELQAAEQEVVEVVLAVIAPYRLRGEDALHAVRGLRSALHGFATLESAGGFGLKLDVDESFHRLVRTLVEGLRQESAQGQAASAARPGRSDGDSRK